MGTVNRYESYPVTTVLLSNIVSSGIYILGFYIISRISLVFAFAYLVYILIFEYRLVRYHCTGCYYYGKFCGFGRGRLSAWLFRKGDTSKFCSRDITWKDMIPDILLTLIPLVTGIVVLILKFEVLVLAAMLILILLATAGNGYIRGKLTCRFCKQQELGCPAEQLFNKNKQA